MSYTFRFTITGDQATCLFWQTNFSKFLLDSGIGLPPEVDMKIEAADGVGSGAPRGRAANGMGGGYGGGSPQVNFGAPPAQFSAPPAMNYGAPPAMGQQMGMGMGSMGTPMKQPSTEKAKTSPHKMNQNRAMKLIRKEVQKHGATGIAGIGRAFRCRDVDHNGHINNEEFAVAIRQLGFAFNDDEMDNLFDIFDDDDDGKVNYEEFLDAVRGPMNLKRKRLVMKVFAMLDTNKNGCLTAEELKDRFNPNGAAAAMKCTPQQAAEQFLSTFDVFDQDGNVGEDEFLKYYKGVSNSIDDDAYFELMLRNAWHMSGGIGQSKCTSCLHVLVTHANGAQEVVELKNDLGVDKHNNKDIMKRLKQQGMMDIIAVDITGKV